MKLGNRVAFLTGVASGISAEVAFSFAREGANVILVDGGTMPRTINPQTTTFSD